MIVDILFDGPPGPVAPRFIEVESPPGTSVNVGEWIDRGDGKWALRFDAGASVGVASPGTGTKERGMIVSTETSIHDLVLKLGPVAFTEGLDRWLDVVFSRLVELVDKQKRSGEHGSLGFCVTKMWLADSGISFPDAIAYLRAKCPDDRIAIGADDLTQNILVVLHTDGREASEAELAAVLNPKEPEEPR